MTSSNALKCVVSFDGTTDYGVAPRKPSIKNLSLSKKRRVFPDLKYLGYKQHYGKGFSNLWATGYYCGSAGHVSQEAVKRYILEQQGKDVFEYSVFGNPNQKIGNFTQTKLQGWSQ